ncbi:MAG: TIGR04076 family protein [Oscillospiraceae bacterium]
MKQVKITVLKKEYYPEYAIKYLTDEDETGPCPLLTVGDTFLYTGGAQMPEGFCPWAWIDIYRGINSLSAGAAINHGIKRTGSRCCAVPMEYAR